MNARRLVAIVVLLPAFAIALGAVDFPPLPASVSIAAARVNPSLVSRLAALKTDRAAMVGSLADFEKECGDVIAGTPADRRCADYAPILQAAKNKHVERSLIFIEDNQAAEAAAKVLEPPIVPKGVLPTGVEDAITGAYGNAGAEVMDRVRRGFQSVQSGDWKLATAWFKDALNRAPNNAGLKRLVEIAGIPPPSPTPAVQLPTDSDVLFLFPGSDVSTASTMKTPGPNDVYYYRPKSGYTRMTADGARLQQALDKMAGVPPGSIVQIVK